MEWRKQSDKPSAALYNLSKSLYPLLFFSSDPTDLSSSSLYCGNPSSLGNIPQPEKMNGYDPRPQSVGVWKSRPKAWERQLTHRNSSSVYESER